MFLSRKRCGKPNTILTKTKFRKGGRLSFHIISLKPPELHVLERCETFVVLNLFYQIEHMTSIQPNTASQKQATSIQCRLCNNVTWHHIYAKQGAIFKCQQKHSNSIKLGQSGFQMYLLVSNITFVSLQHWFAALKYAPVKTCKYVSVKKKFWIFNLCREGSHGPLYWGLAFEYWYWLKWFFFLVLKLFSSWFSFEIAVMLLRQFWCSWLWLWRCVSVVVMLVLIITWWPCAWQNWRGKVRWRRLRKWGEHLRTCKWPDETKTGF